MEITKWPSAFRKDDAFKARILACKDNKRKNQIKYEGYVRHISLHCHLFWGGSVVLITTFGHEDVSTWTTSLFMFLSRNMGVYHHQVYIKFSTFGTLIYSMMHLKDGKLSIGISKHPSTLSKLSLGNRTYKGSKFIEHSIYRW